LKLEAISLALRGEVPAIFNAYRGNDIGIAAQAGQLDPTFGNKGVFSASTAVSTLSSVALQSNGKIAAAGQITNLPSVLRLKPMERLTVALVQEELPPTASTTTQ
jgi:hypothetical protein